MYTATPPSLPIGIIFTVFVMDPKIGIGETVRLETLVDQFPPWLAVTVKLDPETVTVPVIVTMPPPLDVVPVTKIGELIELTTPFAKACIVIVAGSAEEGTLTALNVK